MLDEKITMREIKRLIDRYGSEFVNKFQKINYGKFTTSVRITLTTAHKSNCVKSMNEYSSSQDLSIHQLECNILNKL